ncbi:MAG: PKD domain-containing protein [Planctomycetota bacterium]
MRNYAQRLSWLLLIASGFGFAVAGEWSLRDYQYRRPIIIKDSPGSTVCLVRFAHRGALCSDGRDIRVVDRDGKPITHELLRLGPGDQADILFECSGAQAGATYTVYFGNSKAPTVKPWIAPAGVVMEVRKRANGGCDTWTAYKKMFDASKELEGRVLRSKIFDGYNPIGPNEDYVSYYRAHFIAPAAGSYTFATNSDDASFLLVNGTMVAEYPGKHGGWEGRFGNHNGKITLTAGTHKLEYYHVQYNGECGMIAGWQPPGNSNLRLMAEQNFAPISRARAGAIESLSGKPTLDFAWSQLDHLVVEKCYLVRYSFDCDTSYVGKIAWDFGDGTIVSTQKGKERATVRHGFLKPGAYTITLSVGAKDSSFAPVKQTVVVEPVWLQREEFDDNRWKEYRESILTRLETNTITPVELLPLLTYAKALNDKQLLERCATQIWKLSRNLPPSDHAQVFLMLGLQIQRLLKDYNQATSAFQEAIRGQGDKKTQSRAKLHYAGMLIHYFDKDQEGLDLLQNIENSDLSPDEYALKQIYVADSYAGLGQRDEAIRRYEALRKVVPLTDRQYALGRRGRLLNIRHYIRTGDYESALQELQNIEWETPQERMADDTGLLRAECYVAQGELQRATVLINRLLKVSPASPKVPEMRLLLMKAYQGLHRQDLVAETYAKMKKESPYAAETALGAALVNK